MVAVFIDIAVSSSDCDVLSILIWRTLFEYRRDLEFCMKIIR